jgi:hypothetical protein
MAMERIHRHTTYRQLQENYRLSGPAQVRSILERTMHGDRHELGREFGGAPSYLSDVDTLLFRRLVEERTGQFDNIRTFEAFYWLQKVREIRIRRARRIAGLMGCDHLLRKLNKVDFDPCVRWLHEFFERRKLHIRSPQSVEAARRQYCHRTTIADICRKARPYMSDIPELTFNLDETSNAFNGQYKCITPDSDDHPFVEMPKKRCHMTFGLCFNAAGWKMKPLIILSGLRHLPNELGHFASNAYFATQYSSWMTTHLFAIWAIYFAHELSFYRAALPPALRSEWANLFVDGHSSRINSRAVEYLNAHRGHLIILPAYTYHALQPFDRVIAAPFKAQVKQFYTLPARIRRPVITALQGQSDEAPARYGLVSAIVDAWR